MCSWGGWMSCKTLWVNTRMHWRMWMRNWKQLSGTTSSLNSSLMMHCGVLPMNDNGQTVVLSSSSLSSLLSGTQHLLSLCVNTVLCVTVSFHNTNSQVCCCCCQAQHLTTFVVITCKHCSLCYCQSSQYKQPVVLLLLSVRVNTVLCVIVSLHNTNS